MMGREEKPNNLDNHVSLISSIETNLLFYHVKASYQIVLYNRYYSFSDIEVAMVSNTWNRVGCITNPSEAKFYVS